MLVGNAQHGPLALGTVLEVLVGWSFAACGVFLWTRRPATRLGLLMTLVRAISLLMLFNVLLWFSALNAIITGIGWIFEPPDPPASPGVRP